MPNLVSSAAIAANVQIDGRFWVTETHAISDGTTQEFLYLADAGLDYQAVKTQRAADIAASLQGGS